MNKKKCINLLGIMSTNFEMALETADYNSLSQTESKSKIRLQDVCIYESFTEAKLCPSKDVRQVS